jgi:tRNA pseudouridine55 synthase
MSLEPIAVPVEVSIFDISRFAPPLAEFRVVCSTGTYVRSLAHDLGQKLGCGAHLTSLRRTKSGDFASDNSIPVDKVTPEEIVPIDLLLAELPRIEVEGELEEDRIRHGNSVATTYPPGLARIFNKKGEFLAVADIENGWAHPRVVLTSTGSAEPRKASLRRDTPKESRIGVHESNEGN